MDGKKKLAGWQFGVLLALLVLMLSTMFMPLFNINGRVIYETVSAINKSLDASISDMENDMNSDIMDEFEKNLEEAGYSWDDFLLSKDFVSDIVKRAVEEILNVGSRDVTELLEKEFNTNIDNSEKGYDEFVKFIEKEKGIKLTNISPLYIMTHGYSNFIGSSNKKEDTENVKESSGSDASTESSEKSNESDVNADNASLESVYNSIRIILLVIYILCFVALAMTIIAYAASWSKKIAAAIDLIYGIFAGVMFIVIRITVPKIFDGAVDLIKNMIKEEYVELFRSRLEELGLDIQEDTPNVIMNISKDAFSKFELKNLDVSGITSSIVKFGFIFALITAIILIVFSLICIFVGGKELYATRYMPDDDTSEGFYSDDSLGRETPSDNPFGDNAKSMGTTPVVTPPIDSVSGPKSPVNPVPLDQFAQQQFAPQQQFAQQQPFVQQQQFAQQQPFVQQQYAQPVFQTPQTGVGKVLCTKGVAVGQGFKLPVDRKVIVGKSPSKANLVINNQNVSNIHCSIRYNAARNTYIVKDHSTNGTFVNGVRMAKEVPMEYPAGTILSLADGTNQITLG